MQPLKPHQTVLWQQGLYCFNQGAYFEAHEIFEELWRSLPPPQKTSLQGLIQVAVACVHLHRQNERGARSLFKKAAQNLSTGPLPSGNQAALLKQIEAWLNWLEQSPDKRSEAPNWPSLAP
ncbi:DUF309 domain-containing protein [bacterium (Candidatus Blackallbacteria) CG17_big_fil_post_rev_8_21_14_2_50_48_46]|uniref:DUF309 domain-containing protein n=1 Tax=bacterium (Candidatus Blackallbacteria) CG17_big_fil_post_rev_8_21_14_2_50_48_46 TaxID=2014261 RepID=A0A2M7G4F9_9BACT|nr:MAG: hypothetical protein COW64_02165 [bacterium (Candidatus Blackallbacteria) CG18_big_fil_WC_8_21_14_2_50_49_26]PIW16697.1 MAG: DUF309 domain-containing protein [bacterium (Candidatus Blackallbacteria) CG17_big_fil_post_rev_8_21_14_2_50_48_46]PIW46203.1 MAG: DUF309 domain-containing protein [bacterium (Candidatus Blackallbacteria) CG13_big_fil_rev_8_21_14_2_50_49_14]